MSSPYRLSLILVIIGAINWLLVGLFSLDLVATLFGDSILSRIVYIAVGIAGIYLLVRSFSNRNV